MLYACVPACVVKRIECVSSLIQHNSNGWSLKVKVIMGGSLGREAGWKTYWNVEVVSKGVL